MSLRVVSPAESKDRGTWSVFHRMTRRVVPLSFHHLPVGQPNGPEGGLTMTEDKFTFSPLTTAVATYK